METKVCSKCEKDLPITEFHWKVKNKRYYSYCKKCSSEYSREHYLKNKGKYKKSKAKYRRSNVDWLGGILQDSKCVDCGNGDWRVLQFDHIDSKSKGIYKAAWSGWSKERLEQEIDKCEIRCANCHIIRHIVTDNTWRNS